MIEVAVIAGLFSVWFWNVLNDEEGVLAPLNRLLQKNPVSKKWMMCPWCSGAWFAIIPSFILYHDPLIPALIVAFAAAAIAAMVSSYIQGE